MFPGGCASVVLPPLATPVALPPLACCGGDSRRTVTVTTRGADRGIKANAHTSAHMKHRILLLSEENPHTRECSALFWVINYCLLSNVVFYNPGGFARSWYCRGSLRSYYSRDPCIVPIVRCSARETARHRWKKKK